MLHDDRGVESLPVMLLMGMMLAASTIAIGMDCLDRVQRMSARQRAVDSFNIFVERAQLLSAGGAGNVRLVELDLGGGSIILDGNLVQLLAGDTVVRSEVLSLRLFADQNELRSGNYIMEACLGDDGRLFIKVEEA